MTHDAPERSQLDTIRLDTFNWTDHLNIDCLDSLLTLSDNINSVYNLLPLCSRSLLSRLYYQDSYCATFAHTTARQAFNMQKP